MRASASEALEGFPDVPLQVVIREVPHAYEVLQQCGVDVRLEGCVAVSQVGNLTPDCLKALARWVDASV